MWRLFILCVAISFTGATFTLRAQSLIALRNFATEGTNRSYLPIKQGGKWGYCNSRGEIIIAAQFDLAYPFQGRYAVIEIDSKAYVIDTTGAVLTPPFDHVIVRDSLLITYVNDPIDSLSGWGASTISGKFLLPNRYDEIAITPNKQFLIKNANGWGLASSKGDVLFPPEFEQLYYKSSSLYITARDQKYGALRSDGVELLPCEYDQIAIHYGKLIVGGKNKDTNTLWGCVNNRGTVVIPFTQDTLIPYSALFVVSDFKDSSFVYFPANPGFRINSKIIGAFGKQREYAYIESNPLRRGIIDSLGAVFIPIIYKQIDTGGLGYWHVQDTTGLWGLRGKEGEELIAPKYNRLEHFQSAVAKVSIGTNIGLINVLGEEIVAPGAYNIIVRGNRVKVLGKDSAQFLTLDDNGRIIDRSSYDEFRVIKISGPETTSSPEVTVGSLLIPTPFNLMPWDSIVPFFDLGINKFGFYNRYTMDTIAKPAYNVVRFVARGAYLVGVFDTITSMAIDGQPTFVTTTYGIYNDTLRKEVLTPIYPQIFVTDIQSRSYEGMVRVTMPSGIMALIRLDGSMIRTEFTFIDETRGGLARVCIGGRWSIEQPGETILTIDQFCRLQNLHSKFSFGKASDSKPFMSKFVVLTGGKWGYINRKGEIVIAIAFESAKSGMRGTGIVKQEGKWGLIDTSMYIRIPFMYDALNYLETDSGAFVVSQINDWRYGFINQKGQIVISNLKLSKRISDRHIAFSKTGKWGVMNTSGDILCPENYNEILSFSEGRAAVRYKKKWGYIDTAGRELIVPQFEKVGSFSGGYARVLVNGRWGYIDLSGRLVIEHTFLEAGDFAGGGAAARNRDGFGIIDASGKWIVKPQFRKAKLLDSTNVHLLVVKNELGVSGLYKTNGALIAPIRYDGFRYIGEGMISYQSGQYFGIMDTTGKVVTAAIYSNVRLCSQGLIAAFYNGKWGYLNKSGAWKIKPAYTIAGNFFQYTAYVIQDRAVLLIDTLGQTHIRLKSGQPVGYSENKVLVAYFDPNNKIDHYKYFSKKNVLVTPVEFKSAEVFEGPVARVSKNGLQWGLLSFTGNMIVPPRFFKLGNYVAGISEFQLLYRQGLYRITGEEILPTTYDYIQIQEDLRVIRVEQDNKLGWINERGDIIWAAVE